MKMEEATFLTRVLLKNYKSIAACDVQLQPLTFLVGRNGSGKSNFLDALRFVADALNTSLEHALRDRGGINDVRRRSHGRPNDFSINLEFSLPDDSTGRYAFRIGSRERSGYEVLTEECTVQRKDGCAPDAYFRVEKGNVTKTTLPVAPAATSDRLYLVNASGVPEFRPVYDAFSHIGFYNINPDKIRDLQDPDPRDVLARDGSNLTSVINRLSPAVKTAIDEFLAVEVPGVRGVYVEKFGPKEGLGFRQDSGSGKPPWQFLANSMSDGTLRLLGVLVALLQGWENGPKRVPLIGIEEPELALHPDAIGILWDALWGTARRTQVIVTTHSPELLENKRLDVEAIRAVEAVDGKTTIARIDKVCRSVVYDKLFTVAELFRMGQLQPDPEPTVSDENRST